jgi:alpha-D-ribose 1-methylphosphonate 5-triphosphate synthase subunit PhnH
MTKRQRAELVREMKQIYKNPFTLKMFRAQLAAAASPGFVQQMHANQVKLSLEVADEIIRQVGL